MLEHYFASFIHLSCQVKIPFSFVHCFFLSAASISSKLYLSLLTTTLGGICAAWIESGKSSAAIETMESGDSISLGAKKRSPFSADMFGSVCFTHQHGKFRKLFGDLTRLDARLDICSASAMASKIFSSSARSNAENPMSSPRLNLIFQQQVLFFISAFGNLVNCKFFCSYLASIITGIAND